MNYDDKTRYNVKGMGRSSSLRDMFVLILGEQHGKGIYPMILDNKHGEMLEQVMREGEDEYPAVYHAFKQIMDSNSMVMDHIVVNRIDSGRYYADIVLGLFGMRQTTSIEAPFAIALALTFRVPIYISDALIRESSISGSPHGFKMSIEAFSTDVLQGALADAIRDENYEMASVLRDEIRKRDNE